VNLIVNGRRSITGDTAMRLAHYFGSSAQMWMILQTAYDLEVAQTKAAAIKREVIPGFRVA
jgi:antitoxin HigA-1